MGRCYSPQTRFTGQALSYAAEQSLPMKSIRREHFPARLLIIPISGPSALP